MALTYKHCCVCNNRFASRTPHSRFCSSLCRVRNHRTLKQVEPQPEESSMKEEQRRQDTAEYLKAYIERHMHNMSPEAIAEELQVPLFAVKLHWPNPAR